LSAPSSSQPNAPDRDITVDFAIAVARLRQLGITVRQSTTMTGDVGHWSEDEQTIYLRANATFWQKLYVLADLHALFTQPGHDSPSVPIPRLVLVKPLAGDVSRPHVGTSRRCLSSTRPKLVAVRT
jgi:hypothetical protein